MLKIYLKIIFFLILFCCIENISVFAQPKISLLASYATHIHHSVNTIQFAPGPGFGLQYQDNPQMSFQILGYSQNLIGDTLQLMVKANYRLNFNFWNPYVGLIFSITNGSVLFHTSSSQYIEPSFPEYAIGFGIIPFKFDGEKVSVSIGEIAISSDINYFGKIWLWDIDVMKFSMEL